MHFGDYAQPDFTHQTGRPVQLFADEFCFSGWNLVCWNWTRWSWERHSKKLLVQILISMWCSDCQPGFVIFNRRMGVASVVVCTMEKKCLMQQCGIWVNFSIKWNCIFTKLTIFLLCRIDDSFDQKKERIDNSYLLGAVKDVQFIYHNDIRKFRAWWLTTLLLFWLPGAGSFNWLSLNEYFYYFYWHLSTYWWLF